ncbi:hypothetical protein JTB14_001226 [Gonioctena quinquepunctata]|nr:hypothetical protein JTB14_001226 [Gonioctena quinquepunctata]
MAAPTQVEINMAKDMLPEYSGGSQNLAYFIKQVETYIELLQRQEENCLFNKLLFEQVKSKLTGEARTLFIMESKVAVLDILASIDVNNFVQVVVVLVNDETGEMGEVVKQVGGDNDEAVEDGGVPAAADVIEDLASRFQYLTMEQTAGCAVCYTITFVVLQTIEESVEKQCAFRQMEASIGLFSTWLADMANAACCVYTSKEPKKFEESWKNVKKPTFQRKQKWPETVLSTNTEEIKTLFLLSRSKSSKNQSCRYCENEQHRTSNCPKMKLDDVNTRLKVVIDKLDVSRNIVKSITPKRFEVIIDTFYGEGITPITSGICSPNIFFEEPSYISSTVPSTSHSDVPSTSLSDVPSTSHSDVPSTSLVTIEPPPTVTHLSEEPFIFPSILIPSNVTIEPPPLKPFVSNVRSTFSSEPSIIWSGPSVISSGPSVISSEPYTSTLSSEPPPLIPFHPKVLCEPSTSTSNEPSTSTISSVSSKRTVNNKMNVCKFCKESKTSMKRHLMSKHQDENEVKEYSLLSDENPLKKLKLFQMRRDGNFQSFKESGRVIPARLLPQSVPSKTDYVACPTCFLILKKESLHRHVTKTCKGMSTSSSKGMTYRSRAVSEGIHSDASDVMKNYVFPSFREGIIKECIRYDDMLIVYGNVMTAKYRNQHHYPMIRNRLIRMTKVLVQIKQTHLQVNQFKDILRPEFFNTIIQVINNMGELDDNSGNFKKPSLPTEIGTALKYIISLYKSECIKSKNNVGKSDAEDLAQLLNTALPAHINKTATESLLKQKRTKKIQLPSTEDIRLLNNYLLKHCEIHFDKLSKKFDKQSWMELSGAVLLGLLIFNRRRPGELERALLTDLDTLVSINKDKLLNHNLNDEEQKRVGVYSRFVVRGKLARGVPVLLHDSYKTYLDLVLRHRREAGVHPENPFVFAAPQGNTKNVIYKHLWATTLMRRYSVECGASDPELLRATTLRKHIASNSASLKLNSEELEQLQGYLGHADKIHREYYRQPIAERDIINMGRVLLAAQSPDHLESERQKVPQDIDGPSSALTDSPAAGPSGLCKNTSYSGSSSEFNPSSEGESSDDDTASLATTPKHQPKRRR